VSAHFEFYSGEQARAFAKERLALTGRSCGACSLCCHILGVDEPPKLTKPPDRWCGHCKPGKGGCTIYAQRPERCRTFYCSWLVDASFGEEWYPLTSGIVIHTERSNRGNACYVFEVDARHPDRWLQPRYFELITKMACALPGTTVRAGKRWFTLIPSAATRRLHTVDPGPGIARLVPGKIGPGVARTPAGDFEWIEMVPTPEYAESGWRA
jgi:hypothetical protein